MSLLIHPWKMRLRHAEVIELGALIGLLQACRRDAEVMYDFNSFIPGELASYRGFYSELALGFKPWQSDGMTPPKLVDLLEGALGKTFQGYKGGDFRMGATTEVWCSNYGDVSSTGIIGVRDLGWRVILETAYIDS